MNLCLFAAAGKVHGSLARAGKVRGQTPKVAKQDKKKKPKGRAHKRMQYNRRFVTAGGLLLVVLIFEFALVGFRCISLEVRLNCMEWNYPDLVLLYCYGSGRVR